MFERPIKTLKQSLLKAIENAQEYVADVCFEYPDHDNIWAHKAILMARAPESFRNKYLTQLETTTRFNLNAIIPYNTLRQLLRFWYIADFSVPVNDQSDLKKQDTKDILNEIKSLEQKLELDLLPKPKTLGPSAQEDQWISDLQTMFDQHYFSDVTINIFNAPSKNQSKKKDDDTPVSIPAHRFVLASQSSYFYAVFCTEFREASTSAVHLPSDIFSATTLKVILHYLYTDTIILPPLTVNSTRQAQLNEKKHALRILQKTFTAADYLGHLNTICQAVLLKMAVICHQFKCVCSDCAMLLPSMLLFADKNEKFVPQLRAKLITLYSDPLDSLSPLWPRKPYAILVQSLTQETTEPPKTGSDIISKIFHTSTLPPSDSFSTLDTIHHTSSLIQEITDHTFTNLTKHNAVRALHSLHLCLSQLRSADPLPTWSQSVMNILNQFLHTLIDMIANNFDYYCVEYPILLSCVDGIGFGFSVDFLDFVLSKVLKDGIHDKNAAVLYQGIMRDLGGRQEMVKSVAVDGILLDARIKCVHYLAKNWSNVKAEGGFNTIDKDILKMIAEDINVPVRSLTKAPEYDNFTTMFGFKKRSKDDSSKRLSFGSSQQEKPRMLRTRSLSAASTATTVPEARSSHHSDSEDLPALRRNKTVQKHFRRNDSIGSLTDALLTMDIAVDVASPRPTRLRFALPDTPSRVPKHTPKLSHLQMNPQKVTSRKNKTRAKSPGRRWGIGGDSSEDETNLPKIGYKVELLRRPLPTQGTIKYIGEVDFAKGTWAGIELESRLGNNDGSVDGKRYFETFPQRGVFVKIDDFKVISTGEKK